MICFLSCLKRRRAEGEETKQKEKLLWNSSPDWMENEVEEVMIAFLTDLISDIESYVAWTRYVVNEIQFSLNLIQIKIEYNKIDS